MPLCAEMVKPWSLQSSAHGARPHSRATSVHSHRRFDSLSDDQVRQLCMSGDAQDMSYAMDELTRRNDLRGSQGTSIPTGRRVSMQGLQALFEAGMAP